MKRLTKLLVLLISIVLVRSSSFAAFHPATEWDVRTAANGGDDANGGGFQTGSTGTDRSQGAVYQAYTDILINATTTKASSVLHPFDATTVGNVINITGGVGCTVQRVQAVSDAAGLITFDKSLGAAGSTCTGNLGGSLATIGLASSLSVNYNTINVQAGTYTLTSVVALGAKQIALQGYQTSHGDGGTRPLVTTSTDSTNLFSTSGGANRDYVFSNIDFSNTAAVRFSAILSGQGSFFISDCSFDGFRVGGVDTKNGSTAEALVYRGVEVKNSTAAGAAGAGLFFALASSYRQASVTDSYIHNNASYGIATSVSTGLLTIKNNIIAYNDTGIYPATDTPGVVQIDNNTIAHNTVDGVTINSSGFRLVSLVSNIIYGNGTYGVNWSWSGTAGSMPLPVANHNNAYGGNGTDRTANVPAGTGVVALAATPFTNAAVGDFSLNNTANGGALCRGTGWPGVFVGGTTTSYLDIGAVQTQAGITGAHGSAFVQ